jgi:hypothetical protein
MSMRSGTDEDPRCGRDNGPDPRVVERARNGNLHASLQLKESLRHLPVDRAFGEYSQLLGLPPSVSLRSVRARSMVDAARAAAAHHVEVAPGGLPVVCRAPRSLGDGAERDLHWRSRSAYVACFRNARIRSRSHAIEWEGECLLDFEGWELEQIDDRLELDPAIFRSEGDAVWLIDEGRAPSLRVQRGFMLTGFHTRAFGHWMWEYLPKYLCALEAGCLPALAVLVDEDMPQTHREILERLLPPGSEVVQVDTFASVQVDELWCAPSLCYMPHAPVANERFRLDLYAAPPGRFLPVMRRLQQAFRDAGNGPHDGRLFLARRSGQHRRLENAEAIQDIAKQRGFMVVHPQALDFAQQAERVRRARYVVAPEGSALYLLFLARPGTRVAILNHADNGGQAGFTALLEAAGLDTVMLLGRRLHEHPDWLHFSNYEVDPSFFSAFLDDWLAPAAPGPTGDDR